MIGAMLSKDKLLYFIQNRYVLTGFSTSHLLCCLPLSSTDLILKIKRNYRGLAFL